jgi:hypothetical protein
VAPPMLLHRQSRIAWQYRHPFARYGRHRGRPVPLIACDPLAILGQSGESKSARGKGSRWACCRD